MEVEHQHHFDPPGKKEKSWKHYTLEFFMLFLAVSLGFLTENIRDHYIERERAGEMAEGLYDDLEKDVIHIEKIMKRDDLFINEINSLIYTLSKSDVKNNITLLTYYQASFLFEIDMPMPSRANLDQLTNSGSLRYFKNKKLVTEISQWDNTISVDFRERFDSDQRRLIEEINSVNRVFYPVIIDTMRSISFSNYFDDQKVNNDILMSFENTPAKLITYDVTAVNGVIGWASERKRNAIVRANYFYPEQIKNIKYLMSLLNEEFKIKK